MWSLLAVKFGLYVTPVSLQLVPPAEQNMRVSAQLWQSLRRTMNCESRMDVYCAVMSPVTLC